MLPLVLLAIVTPIVIWLGVLYVREANRTGREQS